MSVSLDNYSFDLDQFYFPTYTAWADQRYSPNISKNQNIFSIGYMQVFCQFP